MNSFASAWPSAGSTDTECGATATEYAILVGCLALAIVAGVTLFGAWLDGYYADMADELRTVLH